MSSARHSGKKSRLTVPNGTPGSENLNASIHRKKKLQSLLQEGTRLNERVENNDSVSTLAQLQHLIKNTNVISKENAESVAASTAIANASENVMDAAVMKIGHEIIGEIANKLGNNEFSENLYAEKVLSVIRKNGKIDWSLYGKKVMHMVKTPRFSVPMLGTFDFQLDPVAKAKKERIVRRRAEIAELKRPEKVVTLQKEEKGAQLISVVREQIEREYVRRNYTPFPYYELILDHDDFMHTVDNAFQISFLARDGHVGLAVDENNDPIVYVPTPQQKKLKEHDKKTKQAVVKLNYGKWMEAKELYGHNKPILNIDRSEFIPASQATQKS